MCNTSNKIVRKKCRKVHYSFFNTKTFLVFVDPIKAVEKDIFQGQVGMINEKFRKF